MLVTPNLVSWQYQGYARNHAHRRNLVIHLISAPVFFFATLSLVYHLVVAVWPAAAVSFGFMLVVLVLQGIGHKLESVAPEPFKSPLDLFARFFTENLFTFWRFLFSGEWARQFRGSQPGR